MGQTTHEIEAHIENTREELGSNLHELERKVKSVADWKQQFQNNPMVMLGVAFGGGILIASVLGGRKDRGESALLQTTLKVQSPTVAWTARNIKRWRLGAWAIGSLQSRRSPNADLAPQIRSTPCTSGFRCIPDNNRPAEHLTA